MQDRLELELVDARKRREQLRLNTLGLLKSEVIRASKEPGAGGRVDDDLVIRVARKEVKRREEAAAAFRAGGREDRARGEEAEAELLRSYLPAELDDAQLEAEVRAVIEEIQPQGPQAFGQLMKAATARLSGRAEGARIAVVARHLLG